VSSDGEQESPLIGQGLAALVIQKILQPTGVVLVDQKAAAAGRLGIVDDAELLRQLHLRLAASPMERVKPLPVDPATFLGDGGFQELGR
jgi:hypothetical protein